MDGSWLTWVTENIKRKCDPQGIVDILLKNNFSIAEIRQAMGEHFPQQQVDRETYTLSKAEYTALSQIHITRAGEESGCQTIDTPKLQLLVVDHFLTDQECDELITLSQTNLRPSTISYGPTDYRTSKTCDLSRLDTSFIRHIDNKITRKMGICLPYSEGIQAQKYDVGEEFKSHTDYFEPYTDEYTKFAAATGNRTWTCMIYLNTTPKGGGTQFVNIGQTFYPRKGRAVIWNNLYPDGRPNPDTMHWGMPVEEGEKFIITKWFREKGEGEMFYEDDIAEPEADFV